MLIEPDMKLISKSSWNCHCNFLFF